MLILLSSVLIFRSFGCLYKLGDKTFNISSLQKVNSFYEVHDKEIDSDFFSLAYVFNFCGDHPQICEDQPGAYEVIDVLGQLTDSCELIGDPKQSVAEPMENGLKLIYKGGSPCEGSENINQNDLPRQSTFLIMCSSEQDATFTRVAFDFQSITRCNLEFTINSPAGCAITEQNKGSSTLIFAIALIFVTYFVLGTLFNVVKRKTFLPPHYEMIKALFSKKEQPFQKLENQYDST